MNGLLTERKIKNIRPQPPKTIRLSDGHCLYLEIAPSGGKWWRWKYSFAGKEKRLSFGVYPQISLNAARDRRDEARKLLRKGIDPGANRKLEKLASAARAVCTSEPEVREWYAKHPEFWSGLFSDIFGGSNPTPNSDHSPTELSLVGLEELSVQTKVSTGRLLDLANSGHLPHWKIDGKEPLFHVDECKSWIQANLLRRCDGKDWKPAVVLTAADPLLELSDIPKEISKVQNLVDISFVLEVRTGIYFLCDAETVVYVGQSVNAFSRIISHQQNKRFDRVLFLRWPKYDLDRLEGALIRRLKPPLNTVIGGAPKEMNAGDDAVVLALLNCPEPVELEEDGV